MCRWVKLYDNLLEWEWHDDPSCMTLLVHLLLMANYKDNAYHGQTIQRGQRMVKVTELAEKVGLSRQQCRTALDKLERSGFITKTSTNHTTIITICNYDRYQAPSDGNQPTSNQQVTNNQPTANQPLVKNEQKGIERSSIRVFSEDTYEARKIAFQESIKPYVDKYGKDMCNTFYSYWTEGFATNQYKMRFEGEKTWSIGGRLATWFKREQERQQRYGTRNNTGNRAVQRELATMSRRAEILSIDTTGTAESNGIDTTAQLPREF